jgi:hypothetical protein
VTKNQSEKVYERFSLVINLFYNRQKNIADSSVKESIKEIIGNILILINLFKNPN